MAPAIETMNLSCRYGRREALHDVTFAVRPGSIFGLLGPNGAGKTTTVRVLMNMVRPALGVARVLGVDSRRLGPPELRQVGYVSENQVLPRWMTAGDLLGYCRGFYPTWDEGFERRLVADFGLPLHQKLRHLSRGMRVKAALVSALAFRPRLLVLDEPFSGLDPVVRDELVQGVLELAGHGHWTVLLSSHDLDEVERLVDDVGFLDGGRLVLAEPLESLQRRFRRIEVTSDEGAAADVPVPGAWLPSGSAGRVSRFVHTAFVPGLSEHEIAERFPGARTECVAMTLREIFVALARRHRDPATEAQP